MAKVTSKLQVTIPRHVANQLRIAPGDDLEWRVEGGSARVSRTLEGAALSAEAGRKLFDEMMRRHDGRAVGRRRSVGRRDRGWTREDLYRRGRAR